MKVCTATLPGELIRIVDVARYPMQTGSAAAVLFRARARRQFREYGICVFDGFLRPRALHAILTQIKPLIDSAFVSTTRSTIYLAPGDPTFPVGHPRRLEHVTRMGTLAEDQLSSESLLRKIYDSADFRQFVGDIVGTTRLYGYADGLTAVNVLVFEQGDRLGWHFDESEYAITLLLRAASRGGVFEYAPRMRARDHENYCAIRTLLSGAGRARALENLRPGSLVLFRGENALHRVTAVSLGGPRMVAVLSYDESPGRCLSEHDRVLLYGRTA